MPPPNGSTGSKWIARLFSKVMQVSKRIPHLQYGAACSKSFPLLRICSVRASSPWAWLQSRLVPKLVRTRRLVHGSRTIGRSVYFLLFILPLSWILQIVLQSIWHVRVSIMFWVMYSCFYVLTIIERQTDCLQLLFLSHSSIVDGTYMYLRRVSRCFRA